MSAIPLSLRERGFQALRQGDLEQAIELLVQAVSAESQDAEAQMFLGVAYSQKGRHAEAKQALETAVELRPREACCHFNLGVALEHAGEVNAAVSAYRRALQINSHYEEARVKVQALSQQVSFAPPVSGRATSPMSGTTAPPAPWLAGAPGADAISPTTTGSALDTGRWRDGEEEPLSLLQTLADWMNALLSPVRFFRDQAGREGIRPALGFLILYLVVSLTLTFIPMLAGRYPWLPPQLTPILMGVVAVGFVLVGLLSVPMEFVWVAVVHGICRMFGGRGSYASSFRASVYALAPLPLLSAVSTLAVLIVAPQIPTDFAPERAAVGASASEPMRLLVAGSGHLSAAVGTVAGTDELSAPAGGRPYVVPSVGAETSPLRAINLLSLVLGLLSFVAYVVYLGIGLSHLHRLGPYRAGGAAIGSTVLFFLCMMIVSIGCAMAKIATRGL